MIRYALEILEKVAFNKELFRKELMKSLGWLSLDEIPTFRRNVIQRFSRLHPDVLEEVFGMVMA
ncbi:MAG: hypothetical protein Kow00127_08290 [Bacteroidales bacterium]